MLALDWQLASRLVFSSGMFNDDIMLLLAVNGVPVIFNRSYKFSKGFVSLQTLDRCLEG